MFPIPIQLEILPSMSERWNDVLRERSVSSIHTAILEDGVIKMERL